MKKLYLSTIYLIISIIGFSQSTELNTNGYQLKFKKIDTLFYSEYSLSGFTKKNAQKDAAANVNLKYSFGKISNEKPVNLEDAPIYTTSYYAYQDGTLQAPTTQLFFKPATSLSEFIAAYGSLGKIEEHPSLKGYYYLYVSDKTYMTGEGIFALCNKLYTEKLAVVVEPVFSRLVKAGNPLRPWEWNIRNTGIVAGGVNGADMGVENAWCMSTGLGMDIAVIDDGVDLTHPDLQANLLAGFDATGNNSGGAPIATNGHGTNCAGIIASVNNTIGTIGVAFNSRIIPIRMGIVNAGVFNTNDAWITNCFAEAVNRGADIISNSWGGGAPSAQIDAAIQNAVTNGRNGLGCVVLFAAGNNNVGVTYPATNQNVIAVGASTPCDTRKRSAATGPVNPGVANDPEGTSCDGEFWWGSNFGQGLDILAPGVLITTTDNLGPNGIVVGDYNGTFNGSSAACPNAAGVVALILAANPNLTGIQARSILERACFKIPNGNFQSNVAGQPNGTWSNQAGYGRVNAATAVGEAIRTTLLITSSAGTNPVCNTATLTVNAPAGTQVTWVSSHPAIATVPATGNPVTVTRVGNGNATITATVNICGTLIPIPIVLKSGIPTVNGGYTVDGQFYPIKIYNGASTDYNELCIGHTAYTNFTVGNANNVTWTRTFASPSNTSWVQNGNNIELYYWAVSQSSRFQMSASNNCGSFVKTYAFRSMQCSSGCNQFQVSPNPVSSNSIGIIVPNIPPPCDDPPTGAIAGKTGRLNSTLTISQVKVYNQAGVVKKVQKVNGVKQLWVDVSGFAPGVYYVEITGGTYKETQQVIIQK